MIINAKCIDIQTIYPQHTRMASLEVTSRDYNISVQALMMGLKTNLPALRERLQERLATAFEREISGSKECNGISFCLQKIARS